MKMKKQLLALLLAAVMVLSPVSYTHLDVYKRQKYAFVSDYVRLAVLYEYGGIYLDTAVELVRPLDELLEPKGFIGMEHSAPSPYGRTMLVNTGSGVGAEPGCEMIEMCIRDRYWRVPPQSWRCAAGHRSLPP